MPFLEQSFGHLASHVGVLYEANWINGKRLDVCKVAFVPLPKATLLPLKKSPAREDYQRRKKQKTRVELLPTRFAEQVGKQLHYIYISSEGRDAL